MQMEKVECKLIDGESVSGHLERVFRPIEGEVAIRSEDEVRVLPFDQVSCVLFTSSSGAQSQFPVRGVQAEEIKVRGSRSETYNVRIVSQGSMEDLVQGFFGVPVNQEDGPSYIFFLKTGVEKRAKNRDEEEDSESKDKVGNISEAQKKKRKREILID